MIKERQVNSSSSPIFVGFLQAAGLFLYVVLISLLFNVKLGIVPIPFLVFGPFIYLLLFVISALICTLIVFTYPFYLAFSKQIKVAIVMLLWTLVWLVVGFIFILIVMTYKAKSYSSLRKSLFPPIREMESLPPNVSIKGEGMEDILNNRVGEIPAGKPKIYPRKIDIRDHTVDGVSQGIIELSKFEIKPSDKVDSFPRAAPNMIDLE